jgi:hypothetical protein
MKKKILLFVSLLVSIASFAQRITYGVSAGATVYNMTGQTVNSLKQLLNFTNDIVTTGPVTGFYGGGYTNIPVSGNLSLEPGVYYSTKGYEINGSYTVKDISILTASAAASLRTSYIDLPVLLKASFNGLQVFAGPQVSYLTTAKLNTKAGVAGINLLNSSMDISSQLNRWDAGITGGVGYQFTNGLRLSAAYERGLSAVDAGKNTGAYNQGIKIGAGFTF